MKSAIKNVILIDFPQDDEWDFKKAIENVTKVDWNIIRCICNKYRFGKLSNMLRYIKYFLFSFRIFVNRKRFDNIVAWQQFYGLLFALYCNFFGVKKVNKLTVMTFIYKPKKGFLGKVYYKMMKNMVNSKYIDQIICYSKHECGLYINLFSADQSKFKFVHLGKNLIIPSDTLSKSHISKKYVLSVGISNRDYNFLIDALKDTDYDVLIFADKNYNHKYSNITISNEYIGEKIYDYLLQSLCLVVPLDNPEISAGQLTILQAMQVGIPTVVTASKGIDDFISDGENGFIIPKDKEALLSTLRMLREDDNKYKQIQASARNRYFQYHTLEAMGREVGALLY